jgi:hypothetical protein
MLELGPKICLRAILDKGPWTKSLGTNLKQIELELDLSSH